MEGISKIKGIIPILPFEPENYAYWMFGLRLDRRDEMILHLKSKGVATGCHYTPMTMQPLFKEYANNCKVANKEYKRIMTLPFHPDLTIKEVKYIIKCIEDFV